MTQFYLTQTLNELLETYFYEFASGKRVLADLMPEIYYVIKNHFETDLTEQLNIDYYENNKLITSFQKNISSWSIARNYKQTKEITDFIYLNKGTLTEKVITDFLTSSKSRYNNAWLDTELRTFRSQINNVNNWYSTPSGPDVMLRYSTANDERVRHSHAILDGLTMPKNDPRWTYLYPPPSSSPYNCRCRVIVVYDVPSTSDVDGVVRDLARAQKQTIQQVEKNQHPAFTGKFFNENETYFIGTPKKIINSNVSK